MDRFIVFTVLASAGASSNLKSNMDRFIVDTDFNKRDEVII